MQFRNLGSSIFRLYFIELFRVFDEEINYKEKQIKFTAFVSIEENLLIESTSEATKKDSDCNGHTLIHLPIVYVF